MDTYSRRSFLKKTGGMLLAGSILSGCNHTNSKPAARREFPNFVVVLTDDMGYGDLSCFGAKGFTTPNIDRMAREGMKFTDFHVSQAICSASRAALLTGCYSQRIGVTGAYYPPATSGLHPEEETIAEVLKKKGYVSGAFGKWHVGHQYPFMPLQQGFDEYFGLPYSNDMWPVYYDGTPITDATPLPARKKNLPPLPLIEGNDVVEYIHNKEQQNKLTTVYTERAVNFIKKNKEKPFFLYLPHSMPHVPLAVSDKFRGKSKQGLYGDVMMEIDWSVGEVLRTLKQEGLEKDTLVIFVTDNGPWLSYGNHGGSAGPLREGKKCMWEGGCRVPCVMHWPGVIPANKVCDKLASTIDFLPTFAALAGAPLPEKKIDGVNIISLLKNEKGALPRNEFWYYFSGQLVAVRRGPWKLVLPHEFNSMEGRKPGRDGWPGDEGPQKTPLGLYNLQTDIQERNNVASKHPEIVAELQKLVEEARQELGDDSIKRVGIGQRQPGEFNKKV